MRPASARPISACTKLLVATEMTGGRFHRIRSAPAAKCPECPKLPDFHTAWAQSDIRSALASRARFEAPLVAVYVQASPEGKSLLLDTTQTIDPKFNALLKKY